MKIKILSRHSSVLSAVRAANIDLSYNEASALRDIAELDRGFRDVKPVTQHSATNDDTTAHTQYGLSHKPSATPRTDEQSMNMPMKADAESGSGWCSVVRASFARTLETELAAARQDVAIARHEAAIWKANHDNQVKLKSIIMSRPDLGDRASRVVALMDELAAAKAECERLRFSTEGHLLKTIQQQTELARLSAENEHLTKENYAAHAMLKDSVGHLVYAVALARAEKAEAALAEAGKDSERLDWLDKVNANINARNGTTYGWRYEINHNRAALTDCNFPALCIRDAIDAAIAQKQDATSSIPTDSKNNASIQK